MKQFDSISTEAGSGFHAEIPKRSINCFQRHTNSSAWFATNCDKINGPRSFFSLTTKKKHVVFYGSCSVSQEKWMDMSWEVKLLVCYKNDMSVAPEIDSGNACNGSTISNTHRQQFLNCCVDHRYVQYWKKLTVSIRKIKRAYYSRDSTTAAEVEC